MTKTVNLLGCGLALLGAIWTFQGIGAVGGSFMTGQTRWIWIGLSVVGVGVAMVVWVNLRRRSSARKERDRRQ